MELGEKRGISQDGLHADGPGACPILTSGHSYDPFSWQHLCHQKYALEVSDSFWFTQWGSTGRAGQDGAAPPWGGKWGRER